MWKAAFCDFKTIRPFSAVPCLIKLISPGIWVKVIVTELISYKTIIVSYQLLFQCVYLSEYFTIKETNSNPVFILRSVQHESLCIFDVFQVIVYSLLIYGMFIYTAII